MATAEPVANGNHRQVWQCLCGKPRTWGTGYPEDPERVIFLRCVDCNKVTPHGYIRIKHRNARREENEV